MAQPSPTTTVTNPRIAKLIELEVAGRIKPEHQTELDSYRAQGWAPKKAANSTTESERTAGFLGSNVGTSITELEQIGKRDADALKPSVVAGILGGDKSLLGNWWNGPDRRQAAGAQDLLLDNALTLGTGAAYNREQFDAYKAAYLPQANDDDATVAAKAKRTRALLEAAKTKAGGSAQDIENAMTAFGFQNGVTQPIPEKPINWRVGGADTGGGDIGFASKDHAEANSLPEGAQQFQQDLSYGIANGKFKTAQDIVNYAKSSQLNEGRGFVVSPEEAQAALDSLAKGGGFNVNTPQFQAPDISADRGEGGPIETGKAFVRGLANVVGADDELNAVADTFSGGTLRGNLAKERAIRDYDEENHFWPRLGGSLLPSLFIPSGANTVARAAGVEALRGGEGIAAARAAARGAFAKRVAGEGAGLAGAYGVGSSDGNVGDRLVSGAVNAATGAAVGFGASKLGQAYLGRRGGGGSPAAPSPKDMGPIAGRLGIEPAPATTGGSFAGAMQTGLGNLPGSMGPVRGAVERETEGLASAARATADKMGNRGTPQSAGEAIAQGAGKWLSGEKATGDTLYRVRDNMIGGPDSPVVMGNTGSLLAKFSNDFPSSPVLASMLEHPAVRKVAAVLEDGNGELTLDEATSALSHIRGVVRNAERSNTITGPLKSRVNALEGAIEADVMNAAKASDAINGRSGAFTAEKAQQQADAHWAGMKQAEAGEMKRPLASAKDDIGTSGEGMFREFFGDMNRDGGNIQRLRARWEKLPKEAKDSYAATAFDQLGRAKPNAQNAADDAWSFDTFGTSWAKLSPEARKLVFSGRGADREVDDIVRYTERLKQLGRSRNFSNTAETYAKSGFVASVASALVGTTAATGSVAAGLGAGAAVSSVYPVLNVAGRAFLKTPAMRQWLRSALHASVKGATGNAGSEKQLQTLIRRLPSIAARNPQVAGEIGAFERSLLSAVNDNARLGTAAASGEEGQNEQVNK